MISSLLKLFGKFGTVGLMSLGISFSSLFITYLVDQIFQFGMGTGSFLVSFFLPLMMASPLIFIEVNTIASLEEAHQKLERIARIDPLTEVPNRSHFFHLAESYLANTPPAQSVGLAVIDVDRFKLINDHYGHLAGDQALRSIAQTIEVHLRSGDIFGRFGGDEFILLCPNTTEIEILEITRYMLQHIQMLSVGDKETETRLSATIGVTTAIPAMASLKQLIAAADRALLSAKQEGGGRVKYL